MNMFEIHGNFDFRKYFWDNILLVPIPHLSNRLSNDIIEAAECLKAWWDSGIIRQST